MEFQVYWGNLYKGKKSIIFSVIVYQ